MDTIRRNLEHGIVIGPDREAWGGSSLLIQGNVIESNGGYGIVSRSGVVHEITSNHFEANGNAIGIYAPAGKARIASNFFSRGGPTDSYEPVNEHHGRGHVVIGSTRSIHLNLNRYRATDDRLEAILVDGRIRDRFSFVVDAQPAVTDNAKVELLRWKRDDGLGYYEYDPAQRTFTPRHFQTAP